MKLLNLTTCIICCTLLLPACKKDAPEALKVNPTALSIATGQTAQVVIVSGTAPFSALSADAQIAKVADPDSKALTTKSTIRITGVKEGTTTVTVTDKNKMTVHVKVTVTKDDNPLKADKTSVTLSVGKSETVKLKGGTAPYTAVADNKALVEAVMKDAELQLKGLKAGSTTVKVTDKQGRSLTLSIKVQ